MKNLLKKEVIIAFIIGIILASSIAVYAYSYYAKDINYTKPGTTTEISVESALNDLYKLQNTSGNLINNDNLELVGTNLGKDISISSGYRYIIICNGWYTGNGTDYTASTKMTSNTNSELLLEKNSLKMNSANVGGGAWLMLYEITDVSKSVSFSLAGSDYNIVFGIK